MLKIAIAENDDAVTDWLKAIISEHIDDYILQLFVNSKELIDEIQAGYRPDLIFLNVLFSDENGISSAKTLRELAMNCILVLMAASDHFAMEGYSVHAYDYLLKPLQRNAVVEILDHVQFANTMKIRVRIKGSSLDINCLELIYIESDKHSVVFHIHDRMIRTVEKLDYYENLLSNNSAFIRCHQSFLVNMQYIKDAKGRNFILRDGTIIPIRKADVSNLKARYHSYKLGSELWRMAL